MNSIVSMMNLACVNSKEILLFLLLKNWFDAFFDAFLKIFLKIYGCILGQKKPEKFLTHFFDRKMRQTCVKKCVIIYG
jgi:hypothetical protein